MKKYRIVGIYHSGRKGVRMTKVTDNKYIGLTECDVYIDFYKCEQFKPATLMLKHHPYYDTWTISEVLALWENYKDDCMYLESINSIYVFEEIK